MKCDIKVSGRAYQLIISPGVIDFRATIDYPEGYKEFIQYVILKPTDPNEFGLDLMSYAEFPADRAFANMSQTGEIYKLVSGKRTQIDRLRFHFKLSDPQ